MVNSRFVKYPSIGYIDRVIKHIKLEPTQDNKSLIYEGTVKMHGTHGDIRRNPEEPLSLTVQSRNRILYANEGPKKDNHGFAAFVESNSHVFHILFDRLGECDETRGQEIMISGEFCGKHIHTGTGLGLLNEPIFVIYDISIILEDEETPHFLKLSKFTEQIECSRMYHILQFTTFTLSIDFPLDEQKIIQDVKQCTEEVGRMCPVASVLVPLRCPDTSMSPESNQKKYIGEGIVWRSGLNDDMHWFKSKIEEFSTVCSHMKSGLATTKDKQVLASKLAEMLVTEPRLHQGLDYLHEFGHEPVLDLKHTQTFITWVVNDVVKEHQEDDIPHDVLALAVKAFGQHAGSWFRKKVAQLQEEEICPF
jgi:RNA ligase